MEKLRIINKNESNYKLASTTKIYNLNIQFYGDKIPGINDIIYASDKILDGKNLYAYGPINNKYNNNLNENEVIKVVTKYEEYYLQRYYG